MPCLQCGSLVCSCVSAACKCGKAVCECLGRALTAVCGKCCKTACECAKSIVKTVCATTKRRLLVGVFGAAITAGVTLAAKADSFDHSNSGGNFSNFTALATPSANMMGVVLETPSLTLSSAMRYLGFGLAVMGTLGLGYLGCTKVRPTPEVKAEPASPRFSV